MAEPPARQGDKLNVFISYSRDDLAFADQLDAALGFAGFGTTIDRHGISAGEDWQTRLGALIRDSDTVVFVLSPSSARSKTCAWEVEEAVRLGKRILPVICEQPVFAAGRIEGGGSELARDCHDRRSTQNSNPGFEQREDIVGG